MGAVRAESKGHNILRFTGLQRGQLTSRCRVHQPNQLRGARDCCHLTVWREGDLTASRFGFAASNRTGQLPGTGAPKSKLVLPGLREPSRIRAEDKASRVIAALQGNGNLAARGIEDLDRIG